MERNKSFNITLFLDHKAINFQKLFYYCFKHSSSTTSYYSQNISFTKFYGKRKYYKEPTSSVGSQG